MSEFRNSGGSENSSNIESTRQEPHVIENDELSPDEELAERRHWVDIMRAFLLYSDMAAVELRLRDKHLMKLPAESARHLPPSVFNNVNEIFQRTFENQRFFEDLVHFQDYGFTERKRNSPMPSKYDGPKIPLSQLHRLEAVLHSITREWSSEGLQERELAFVPLKRELSQRLPVNRDNAYRQRVLVPGCGVGRLPLEISALGSLLPPTIPSINYVHTMIRYVQSTMYIL